MRRLTITLVTTAVLASLGCPLAVAAPAATSATAGSRGDVAGDSWTFGGYSGRNVGSGGLRATFVVPEAHCTPIEGYRMTFPGVFVWSNEPFRESLNGGAGVHIFCENDVVTMTPVVIDPATKHKLDRPVEAGDRMRAEFVIVSEDVGRSRLTNLTRGWTEETETILASEIDRAEVSNNMMGIGGIIGDPLAPETTKFSKVFVDGEKLRRNGVLEPFNLDFGRGDPVLVPTKVKKSGFKVNKYVAP